MAGRDASPTSTSSTMSNIVVQAAKQGESRSSISASPPHSTPPTSLGDEASVRSDVAKTESLLETFGDSSASQTHSGAQPTSQTTPADTPNSDGRRSIRRSRASVPTYNVQILAGTAIHTPTKYLEKHHKNVLHGRIEHVINTNSETSPRKRRSKLVPEDIDDPVELQLATEAAQAAQRRKSSRALDLRKEALRNLTAVGEVASSVAQKGQELLLGGKNKVQHALRATRSEPSLAQSLAEASSKRPRASRAAASDSEEEEPEPEQDYVKPKTKKWLQQGLYVGQHRDFDARLSESQNRIRKKSNKATENRVLPLPMFAGERLLKGDPRREYRNFKLPFDTYNPLPRKIKVDGWVKLHKNRFIGEASALWKRDKQDSSSCYCLPEDGCGEACHNRIMAYECDSTNCRLTPEQCGNRPFAQLKKRAKGNGYDYGVEVTETGDRGYGVRAMRCFDPYQIIVEYAGEIITQTECEDRMKKVYKKDKCYYLMSFDNKMIIDATRGTIARFVNHSCEPNCEMIKWTVGNEPRMALFAGSRGIVTGEELTYDYNFDPFSSTNIQECRCGTRSCRGVLGPKPKHQSQNLATSLLAGTKRKIQEVFGTMKGSESPHNSPKKRKFESVASSTLTKAQNAIAEASAAREKAEKDAADLAAQIASREHRALRRSASMTLSSRRSKILRKATRHSLPVLKASRKTTVNVKHRTPKPIVNPRSGALRGVDKTSRLAKMVKRNAQALKARKSLSARRTKVQRTPNRAHTASDSEDSSPNITPASLRSAARAASTKKLTQSKLPFKPLGLSADSIDSDTNSEAPDSDADCVEEEMVATSPKRGRGRPKATASIRKRGAGVKKSSSGSTRGTNRALGVGVVKTGAGLGLRGTGGVREGGSGSGPIRATAGHE